MAFHETTREALDWSMLIIAMDRLCGTSMGRSLVKKSIFAESPAQARYLYSELEELKQCVQEDCLPPFRGMPDVHSILNKAKRNEARVLSEIQLVVQLVELIKEANVN